MLTKEASNETYCEAIQTMNMMLSHHMLGHALVTCQGTTHHIKQNIHDFIIIKHMHSHSWSLQEEG